MSLFHVLGHMNMSQTGQHWELIDSCRDSGPIPNYPFSLALSACPPLVSSCRGSATLRAVSNRLGQSGSGLLKTSGSKSASVQAHHRQSRKRIGRVKGETTCQCSSLLSLCPVFVLNEITKCVALKDNTK